MFKDTLKAERKRLNLTQQEAADLLDISKSCVEKWEYGTLTPNEITQEGALLRLKNHQPPVEAEDGTH